MNGLTFYWNAVIIIATISHIVITVWGILWFYNKIKEYINNNNKEF
jgi:heme/copper-type cytochrome/quinol oxidase subunit 4